MKIRVKCLNCGKDGRFEKVSGNTYRINHGYMKNGERIRKSCPLGNPYNIIEKLRVVSKVRPDLVDDSLVEQVLRELKNNDKSKSNTLLLEILELNRKLGFGWHNERHDLVKQDNCPHCKQKIAVRFRRIGANPTKTSGRYDIDKLKIEQGTVGLTSRFKKKFTGKLRNQFERGVEKGNTKEKDIFYEDV